MANAPRDENQVPALLGVDESTGLTRPLLTDASGNLLIAASGVVTGPISSTDNAIARWNGTGGSSLQNSGVTIDDSNNISVPAGSRIDIGATDAMVVNGSAVTGQLQINSDTRAIEELHSHSATAGSGAVVYGARSRGTTAAPTIVQSGDSLFKQFAVGYDGTDYAVAGYTEWTVGGTPGSNDMPGSYVIAVSPDGSQTPAAAITVNSDKSVNFAGTLVLTSGIAGGGLVITEVVGTSQSASVNSLYITNNAGAVTVTIPTTAAVGDIVRIVGKGAGGWIVAQNASESINFGNQTTTVGIGGSLASTNQYDCVELVCTVADTTWTVMSSIGNITVT